MSQFALQNLSIEALEPALEDIRSHLQEMGLTLHVLNGAGAVIAKSTGCPLAELGGCGIASHVSKLAWTATNTSKMAQCTTQCGCRAVSLPILQRRRLVGTASVCFPVQETTRSKELAEHCKNKKLDYFKTRKLVRNVARYRSSDMDNIANMLNWILRREQSISAADHELKSLSFNLSNTYEELSLLYMISGYMHVTGKPQDFLQIVCNDLREVINLEAAVGVIYPRNPEITDEITVIAGSVDLNEDQIKILKSTYVMPMLKKSDGTVLANRCEIDPESGLGNKIQNLIVVPLVIDSNHSGMLIGINKQKGDFDSNDMKLINSISNQVSIFLANNWLYADLQDLLMGVLHALTATIDAKDLYTSGHSQRVAMLSRKIAVLCDLSPKRVQQIYLAGLLHDIGKIGVPETVLCKSGRLTDEEYATMKRHPDIGAKILQGIKQLDEITVGILTHHERPDGRGYPRGLAGADVPLDGLIVGLADVFDAMTSDRTYRKALPIENVIAEIKKYAGTQFNADLVEKFLKLDLTELLQELRNNSNHCDKHVSFVDLSTRVNE